MEGLYVQPKQLVVSANVADGPTKISATTLHFRSAYIQGRALNGTPNTATVSIGLSATAGQQPLPVQSNKEVRLTAPDHLKYSFSDFYFLVASNGDSLVIWYN